jgi:hypothetical protein
MTAISWPLPVGTVVRGEDCIGRPFEAAIIGYRGSLTPHLSDGYITPASLIREVVSRPATAPVDDDGFLPNDPITSVDETGAEPMSPRATAQMSLF